MQKTFIIFVVAFFIIPSVQAQTPLTEEAIKAFYQDMLDIQFKNKSPEDLEKFIDSHVHDDLKYDLFLKNEVFGEKREEEKLTIKKGELLKKLTPIQETGADSYDVRVLDSQISAEGQEAKVKVLRTIQSVLHTKTQNGIMNVQMVQSHSCDDKLMLSQNGFIQLKESICQVEGTVKNLKN